MRFLGLTVTNCVTARDKCGLVQTSDASLLPPTSVVRYRRVLCHSCHSQNITAWSRSLYTTLMGFCYLINVKFDHTSNLLKSDLHLFYYLIKESMQDKEVITLCFNEHNMTSVQSDAYTRNSITQVHTIILNSVILHIA